MQPVTIKLDRQAILQAIRSCLPADRTKVELHEPSLRGNEWKYIKECLDTNWVSSSGKFVDEFERQLAEFTGVRRAFAVVNGTAALHIALKMSGVDVNDEVLVPDLTFVATANAVAYCSAVPHFVDCDERTLGVDPVKLDLYLSQHTDQRDGVCVNRSTARKIKALIVMHTFGHPSDLDPLQELCRKHHLVMIEDAAEAIGSYYKKRHVGHWGKFSVLSFNGNKTITTGGGGAILTDDETLGVKAKHIATTAKLPHPWAFNHDEIGYNYRMPNINAAMGVAQMEKLTEFLERKRALAMRYKTAFKSVTGVKFLEEPAFAKSNYWLNGILLDREFKSELNPVLEYLIAQGIRARPAWTLMHKLPMYAGCPRMDVSVAEDIESRLINIPSSAFL